MERFLYWLDAAIDDFSDFAADQVASTRFVFWIAGAVAAFVQVARWVSA